ncbi:MAG: hypothetical protein JWP44_4204 [Mucilaginibacter sp.]|nr:hypothetical protein [Mucilaginibacter sp.]
MIRQEERAKMSDSAKVVRPLSIRLFGTFDVQVNDQPLPRLRSQKGQWLLALLILRQGQQVERSWLAGVLWPESADSQALANLRLSLTDLRRSLGRAVIHLVAPTPRTLRFDQAGASVDVSAFDAAILKGDTASLEAATAVYRGALLEGCEEEWLLPERHERAEAYSGALETLAKQARAAGHPEQALPFLKKLIAADPLRTSAQRALMQALADTGDHAAVTQVYRDFRLYLHEALHTQPDPETCALYEKLRAGRKKMGAMSPPVRMAPSPPLPSSLTYLIGREAEVGAVCACLERSRLVTLTGPGGVGKTRLAIAAGQQLRETFPEQVWFVSLAELPDAQRLVETVRDALHLAPDQADPFAQVVRRLSAGPSLLILDNYEHLVEEGARLVEGLLASTPSLTCLVTSRHALHLVGETQYRVPSLGFPTEIKPAPLLLQFPGVRLYMERAAARRTGFQLTQDNAHAIVALCVKLEGIPLAIELVAAWADMLTPLQMLTRLEERFSFPGNLPSPTPARHGSLQTVFDSSYSLLAGSEQHLLCCLAVFAGGWTLEAAEAVCGEAPARQEEMQTLVWLKRLVEKSLVLFQENTGTETVQPRYQLLEMTRRYALEQFSPEQRDRAEQRHADYFLKQALAGEAEVAASETIFGRVQKMQEDRENYYAALQRWKRTDIDQAFLLLAAMGVCGLLAAHSAEVQLWISRLTTRELPLPSVLQAKQYVMVAEWANYSTSPVWLALMEKAYALAEGCDDKQYMARALCHLGESDLETGNKERARQRLEAALDYSLQVGDRSGVGFAQQQLIYVTCAEHDLARAHTMAEALLQSGREQNRWFLTTHALEALAHIAGMQQDYPRGRAYGEQAMAIYPEAETISRSNMLRRLARTAGVQGDFQAARDYLAVSVTLCQAGGALAHEAWSYYALANVAQEQGIHEEGRSWMRQALRLFDTLGETGSMVLCLGRMARLAADQPEFSAFLWSAYVRFLEERDHPFSSEEQEEIATERAALRAVLPEVSITVLEMRSASLNLREVVRYALGSGAKNDFAS